MLALVTGVAGFIGSTLADRLISEGWTVRGVDAFTPYYDERIKRSNLRSLLSQDRFELVEADLLGADLVALLDDVDVVFHEAGQPGVRLSWATGFGAYVDLNITVSQRLLEAARVRPVHKFVFASSSSVYGEATRYPTTEGDVPRPHSPYGVTKLAAELLCNAYAENFGIPTVSLRYFTVYGPRQRPDMGIHRLIEAALHQRLFPLYGDGSQVRDFTFVDDVVEANLRAVTEPTTPGTVVNIAGGSSTRLSDLIDLVGRASGLPVPIEPQQPESGDVRRTGGSVELAARLLAWQPTVDLETGVARQVAWHIERVS